MTGIIHTHFIPRQYGFIVVDDGQQFGGRQFFFHETNFKSGVPQVGARVEFSLGAASSLNKPPQAINIYVIEKPPVVDVVEAFANVTKAVKS